MANITIREISEATVRALSAGQAEPAWLRQRRLEAWRTFQTMAMPSGLEEEWRRTGLKGLDLEAALQRADSLTGTETAAGGIVPRMDDGAAIDSALAERSGLDGLLLQQAGRTRERF